VGRENWRQVWAFLVSHQSFPAGVDPRAIARSISHPFPLRCSSSALLSTKPYSSGAERQQHGHQALLSSPNRVLSGAHLLPPAPHEAGRWCSVPAISGTRLGQELSFNEILLKDSVTNSHLSKWTFGAFSPWCQCCGWMFPRRIKPDANIGLFYMTAIKLLKHTRQEASGAFCCLSGLG